MAAATVAKALQSAGAAQAQKTQANYEAEVARQQAEYQRQLAESDARQAYRDSSLALGRQLAGFAASGVDPGTGSALLAQQSLAGQGELQALKLRNAGSIRAASLERSAALAQQRARSAAQGGQNALLNSGIDLLGDFYN